MEWIELVIKIGALISAAALIWKGVTILIHIADDMRETKEYVAANIKNVESIPTIERHCLENYLTGLRLTIMNKDMPIGERIAAGTAYIKLGGNGAVKQYLINELHINEVQKDLEE
ncbi:MAG: hypothetical protein J6J13_00050 [Clostridia bacterium]|nr:hypothetical protein [Clostridia bacterium]